MEGVRRAPKGEVLQGDRFLGGDLQLLGHSRGDLHDAAKRIARKLRREGTIEHVNPVDFLGRNEAPARRPFGVVVADKRRQQQIVGVDEAARRGIDAPGAGLQHRLVVAVVAFAKKQTRRVFERVFRVDNVDLFLDVLARDAGHGVGQLKALDEGRLAVRQRGRPG